MKIAKQAPLTPALDNRLRGEARDVTRGARATGQRPPLGPSLSQTNPMRARNQAVPQQLNQQSSLIQATDAYLAELQTKLGTLKLQAGAQLDSAQNSAKRDQLQQGIHALNQLLAERKERTGDSLDARFDWSHSAPAQVHFSLQGMESLAQVKSSGAETLVFSAGSAAEPMVVLLDEHLSDAALLKRMNNSLASAGIQVTADSKGGLTFALPESSWQLLHNKLKVTGEGRLFPIEGVQPLPVKQDGLTRIDPNLAKGRKPELRQLLDVLVRTDSTVSELRREFDLQLQDIHNDMDDSSVRLDEATAEQFVQRVFAQTDNQHFGARAQAIVGQAHLSRASVVGLLSW